MHNISSVLDSPNMQRGLWGTAAVCAAIACPVAFTVSMIAGSAFSCLNDYTAKTTGRSIIDHGRDYIAKAFKALKLEKSVFAETVDGIYGLVVISTVTTVEPTEKDKNPKKVFDVVIPVIYGVTAFIFSLSFAGALSGLKTGALVYREFKQIIPASNQPSPKPAPAARKN